MPRHIAEEMESVFGSPWTYAGLVVLGVGHYFGIGELIDAVVVAALLAKLGRDGKDVMTTLLDASQSAANATSVAEIDRAAEGYAVAFTTILGDAVAVATLRAQLKRMEARATEEAGRTGGMAGAGPRAGAGAAEEAGRTGGVAGAGPRAGAGAAGGTGGNSAPRPADSRQPEPSLHPSPEPPPAAAGGAGGNKPPPGKPAATGGKEPGGEGGKPGGGNDGVSEVPQPNLERPVGSGGDGKVFEVQGNPNRVIKKFYINKQVRNELDNLARGEKAEGFGPDNVVKVLQRDEGYLVKEKVTRVVANETQVAEGVKFFKALDKAGVKDFRSNNVMFGFTESNPTPRWILIE